MALEFGQPAEYDPIDALIVEFEKETRIKLPPTEANVLYELIVAYGQEQREMGMYGYD